MKQKKFLIAALVIILSFGAFNCSKAKKSYDLLILNGTIHDGSGNPSIQGDLGIKDKKIVEIGQLKNNKAEKIIDASGLIVSPGFIDVHTHCDRGIANAPTVDNYILQGVTTVVGGNCGGHSFPLKELFQKLEKSGISLNFACLAGHNTIRREIMEFKMEAPTDDELLKMKSLLDDEMKAGAMGFSTGLSYLPGIYSDTQELIELASVVTPYGGIYASHIRDQGDKIVEAIEEAIEIGGKNGIPVLISHIKLAKDSIWGKPEKITKPIEEALSRGVEVYMDQYPYTATSSGFRSSLPAWAFEGGAEEFLERLKDRESNSKIKEFIIQRRLTSTKDINKLETIYIANYKKNPDYQGKNLKEILELEGKKATVDNGAELIIEIEKNGGASGVFFQMDEKDVEYLMRLHYNMVGSDGGIQELGKGVPHPRNYGTFPRIISCYVREKGIISLAVAIRKMTSLPAQAFRIKNRGKIEIGMFADITIFDYEEIRDKATFSSPHQYNVGISCVLVNGEIVVENNHHIGTRPGMVLYGPGKTAGEKN